MKECKFLGSGGGLDYITTDIDGKGQIIYDSEVAMSLRKVYIGHVLRK
jgi:hypothetical protein